MENKKMIPVRFPDSILAELENYVGSGNRSKFIIDATCKELNRLKQRKAIHNAAGIFNDEDYPGFKTPEDVSNWVRTLREESEARRRELFGD